MKAAFINPFLNATVNVIKTMAFLTPVPEKPYLKKDHVAKGDISGVIGLAGDLRGSVAVTFSEGAAIKIVGSMLGEEFKEITSDVKDAVGELTNMIAGDARRVLSQMSVTCEAGIPTVVIGHGHTIEHISSGPIIVIPFKLADDFFLVEASLENS